VISNRPYNPQSVIAKHSEVVDAETVAALQVELAKIRK